MKTHFTYWNITFLLFTFLFINSCSKDDLITYDLVGNWKVIYYVENDNKIVKSNQNTWLDVNNGDITLNFDTHNSNGEGTFSGITVSNAYSGDYKIEDQGNITFKSIATTEINEPEWTKLFKISSVKTFEIKNSILLLYYNNNNNNIIALERN